MASRSTAAIALALAIALLGCGGRTGPGSLHPLGPPLALSLPALDGGMIDVASHRGQVVVVHLFTLGSLAAAADVEQLQAVHAGHRAVVIAVALDADGRPLVAPW